MLPLTDIEKLTEKRLTSEFEASGKATWGAYMVAREKMFTEILPFIRSKEPDLTDHDDTHIVNVLDNAYKLLQKTGCAGADTKKSLTTTELYFLVLSILFHDSGNVFGRDGHENRLHETYAAARGNDQTLASEKRLLFQIVRSHCGATPDGSKDTIAQLDAKGSYRGKQVDCQRVASVLRLADELAEGPHRTSLFMQMYQPFSKNSQVYHDYAAITSSISIDPGYERIAVVYDINIAPDTWGAEFDRERLATLLNFCYHRMAKVDVERKYTRHYCSLLRPYKKSEFSFHFHCKTRLLELSLPKVVLDDLVTPDSPGPHNLISKYKDFDLTLLMPRLQGLAVVTPPHQTKQDT